MVPLAFPDSTIGSLVCIKFEISTISRFLHFSFGA